MEEDQEFQKNVDRIVKLYSAGHIKTPKKEKMLEVLFANPSKIDLLGSVSSKYSNSVLEDRTKKTTLVKQSIQTSARAAYNEIAIVCAFKYVTHSKNRRVLVETMISPFRFSFKGSAAIDDVKMRFYEYMESQWFRFYRALAVPSEEEWNIVDEKGVAFELTTVSELLPGVDVGLKQKKQNGRTFTLNYVLERDLVTESSSPRKRSNTGPVATLKSQRGSYKIEKTVPAVHGVSQKITEAHPVVYDELIGATRNLMSEEEFVWKGTTVKLPVDCVVGAAVSGLKGTFRDCFIFAVKDLPSHALVGKTFKTSSTIQAYIYELKTMVKAQTVIREVQKKLEVNKNAAGHLLTPTVLKRLRQLRYVDAIILKLEDNSYCFVEEKIMGTFTKYTGNDGCSNDVAAEMFYAISHFSAVISDSKSILVDFQGSGKYLTDPAMHHSDCTNLLGSDHGEKNFM